MGGPRKIPLERPKPVEPVTDKQERAALVASCEPQIHKLSSQYANDMFQGPAQGPRRHEVYEDLMAAGRMGAAAAVERFDKARGIKFFTFAWWWIRKEIWQRVRERTKVSINERLTLDAPINGEQDLKMPGDSSETSVWSQTLSTDRMVGLYQESNGSGESWSEEDWEYVFKPLEPRTREFMLLRHRDGLTLTEIGRRYGISKERARQVLLRGYSILRTTPWLRQLAGVE